jgi:hypothetical protein
MEDVVTIQLGNFRLILLGFKETKSMSGFWMSSRVTGLGEFSLFGRLFTSGQYPGNYIISHIFAQLFYYVKDMFSFFSRIV